MSDAMNFGKQAAGFGGAGKAMANGINWLTGAAKPAAKAVEAAGAAKPAVTGAANAAVNTGRQMVPPPLPTKLPAAALERTTGTILDASGRPVPRKASPPVPMAPVKISPAEAAAGRAKIVLTPEEIAARTAGGLPAAPATSARPAGVPGAGTGVRPGAVAPSPPPPTHAPVRVSPAEAAAGRAKVTITPEEVAGVKAGNAQAGPPSNIKQPEFPPELQRIGNDLGMASNIVSWGGPTAIAALLGGLMAPRKKKLMGALRGAGIGAAGHAGASLGLRAGTHLGGDAPVTGGILGGAGGGIGAALAAGSLLPGLEDEEEKKTAALFGAKMAEYVNFYERAPKKEEPKKKLPDHEVFNNALMRAEAAGEEPSVELFNKIDKEHKEKSAKSVCMPCGPKAYTQVNKGVYQTGPMHAMEAQESVPESKGGIESTEETAHDEKDIHNSGQKSAYWFGRKMAAFGQGVTPSIPHIPSTTPADAPLPPQKDSPALRGMIAELTGKPYPDADAAGAVLSQRFAEQQAQRAAAAAAQRAATKDQALYNKVYGEKFWGNITGIPGAISRGQKWVGENLLAPMMQTTPKFTFPDKPAPATPPKPGEPEAMMAPPGISNPKAPPTSQRPLDSYGKGAPGTGGLGGLSWGALGGAGLGAAGLAALTYHLMNQKKKKKDEEEG